MYVLVCRCGKEIELNSKPYIVKCPRCGKKWLLKKGFRYTLLEDPSLKKEGKQLKLDV